VCGYTFSCKRKRSKHRLASGEVKAYTYDYYRCSHQSRTWRPDSCDRGQIVKTRIEPYVLEALNSLLLQPHLWEQVLDNRDEQKESWQTKADSLSRQIAEVDAQLNELLNLAISHRNEHSRARFSRKEEELENRRSSFEQQLGAVQEQLNLLEQSVDKARIIEESIARIQEMGGLIGLPFDAQRQIILQLVDDIVLDTKEQWFEIRGVLQGRFGYDDEAHDNGLNTGEKDLGTRHSTSGVACGMVRTVKA
jgi:hypothetical protein